MTQFAKQLNDYSWSNPVINKAHIWVTWRLNFDSGFTPMIPMIPKYEPQKDDESYLSVTGNSWSELYKSKYFMNEALLLMVQSHFVLVKSSCFFMIRPE